MPRDCEGREIREGDIVLVPFKVLAVSPAEDYPNLVLVIDDLVDVSPSSRVRFMANSRALLKLLILVLLLVWSIPSYAASPWQFGKKRPPQAPPASVWVVSVTTVAPSGNQGKEVIPSRQAPTKARRSVRCQCSPACTCGCQEGEPCTCPVSTASPSPVPVSSPVPQPFFLPPPIMSGFGGGFGGFGGGFGGGGGGCSS